MSKTDDTKLIERCISGDREAFEALLAEYERPVYNAAFRMLNNRDDARDVTQTVFLKVFQNFGQYDPSRRFFSWIYRITLNEGPEQECDSARLSANVQAALMTVKADYRTVVILKHFLGCSYVEISEILELPEKTVKSRLYTARQQLKDELTDLGLWQ